MEGKAHVPVTCSVWRRPVPTVSKVRGSSNVPVLELVNFTTKRTDSPARIFKGEEEGGRGVPKTIMSQSNCGRRGMQQWKSPQNNRIELYECTRVEVC